MKNNKKQFIGLLIFLVVASVLSATSSALAAPNFASKAIEGISSFDLPGGGAREGVMEGVVGNIIQVFISIFGIIFLALMVYGGFKWMIAQGREDEVSKAKQIIQAAIIGLGVVLIAYIITYFIVTRFYQATQA